MTDPNYTPKHRGDADRPGDDSDVETGRCCPHCRTLLTEHNLAVWGAGHAVGVRHATGVA